MLKLLFGSAIAAPECPADCRAALDARLADCLAGTPESCLALEGRVDVETGFREHGCDRLGAVCDTFLASAAEAWRTNGDGLWWRLRATACDQGDAASCATPDDRLAGPTVDVSGVAAVFDGEGRLVVADGSGLGAVDPHTGSDLGWVELAPPPGRPRITALARAPGGVLATIEPRSGPHHEARDLAVWSSRSGSMRWIPGPVCAHGAVDGGGWVVRGTDTTCAEVVSVERFDIAADTVGARWSWAGPPPRAVDAGPGGTLTVDTGGVLRIRTGLGLQVVGTPAPLSAAWWVGPDRVIATAHDRWFVVSRGHRGWTVSDGQPGALLAAGGSEDGTRVAIVRADERGLRLQLVEPTTGESTSPGVWIGRTGPVHLAFDPRGEVLASVDERSVRTWEHGAAAGAPRWQRPSPITEFAALPPPEPMTWLPLRVEDGDAAPVDGATVEWLDPSGFGGSSTSGPDGLVEVPESARVFAATPDGRMGSATPKRAGEVLTVATRDAVPYRVVDEAGAPVPNVVVRGTVGGRTWSGADGRGWCWDDPTRPDRGLLVGWRAVELRREPWVVGTGQVVVTDGFRGHTWVTDAAGVRVLDARGVVQSLAAGPATVRFLTHDGRAGTRTVDVPRGGRATVPMAFDPPARLRVHVSGPDGAPLPGAVVGLTGRAWWVGKDRVARTNPAGDAELTLPDGDWVVTARSSAGWHRSAVVALEAGADLALELRAEWPADFEWPGLKLDDDDLRVADSSPLAAYFDAGDHLVSLAGDAVTHRSLQAALLGSQPVEVGIRSASSEHRTAVLPGAPECTAAGRCTVVLGDQTLELRTTDGDTTGRWSLAPPRPMPEVPALPPTAESLACWRGEGSCTHAWLPPPPTEVSERPPVALSSPEQVAFTPGGLVVAVDASEVVAVDPSTGSVVARAPRPAEHVGRLVGGVRDRVRSVVGDAAAGFGLWDGRTVRPLEVAGGVLCGGVASVDGAVARLAPDRGCQATSEVVAFDDRGRVRLRVPAPVGTREVDGWGATLYAATDDGLYASIAGGGWQRWAGGVPGGLRATGDDEVLVWWRSSFERDGVGGIRTVHARWAIVGPDGPRTEHEGDVTGGLRWGSVSSPPGRIGTAG
jgi:hypothetical protein